MSALSEQAINPIATLANVAKVLFASLLPKEPAINNSADNSSFRQQRSFVLSTLLPYHITGIKDISLRYAVRRDIAIERRRRLLKLRPPFQLYYKPPSVDKIGIAVEKLKNIKGVKSADDDLEAGDQPLTPEFVLRFVKLTPVDKVDIAVEKLKNAGLAESANRIDYLRSTDDMEEGDQPLTAESVMGFVDLMRRFRDLGEPMLGIFSQGTLAAEWHIADDKHLMIEPLDDKNASFAFIGPANKPGEKFRLNGRGSIEEVIGTLRKCDVDQWKK